MRQKLDQPSSISYENPAGKSPASVGKMFGETIFVGEACAFGPVSQLTPGSSQCDCFV